MDCSRTRLGSWAWSVLSRWELDIIAEVLAEAERVKPAQYARRKVFAKHGVTGGKAAFIAAIVSSIWRLQGFLDEALAKLGIDVKSLDIVERAYARLTTYLLLFEPRCYRDEACVNLLRNLCTTCSKIINAWLSGELEVDKDATQHMMPSWLLERLRRLLPNEWEELIKAFNTPPPVVIRVNTLKASYDMVWAILEEEGREPRRSKWAPEWGIIVGNPRDIHASRVLRHGLGYIQDEASIVASLVLAPRPGETVVDLAAAPGGKTLHMAALMRNRGRIIAIDVSKLKVKLLERNIVKHGARIVEVKLMDGRRAPEVLGRGFADRVLLDAPCTSSGTLARNPDLRWRISDEEIKRYSRLQYELLKAAVELVKPGGLILYTTCSIFPEEGEEVVKRILDERTDVELVDVKEPFGSNQWMPGTMRAWPHKHGTIGFFYALLRKTR